jgi:hypothetical protein
MSELYKSRYYKRATIRISDRLIKELVSRADTSRMPANDAEAVGQEPIEFFHANVIASLIDSYMTSIELNDPSKTDQIRAIIFGQAVPESAAPAPDPGDGDEDLKPEDINELDGQDVEVLDTEGDHWQGKLVVNEHESKWEYSVAGFDFNFDDIEELLDADPNDRRSVPLIQLGTE